MQRIHEAMTVKIPGRLISPIWTKGDSMNIPGLQPDTTGSSAVRKMRAFLPVVRCLPLTRRATFWTAVVAAALFGTSLHAAGTKEEAPSGFQNIAQAAMEKEPPATSAQSKLDAQIVLALKQSRGEIAFDKRSASEPDIPIKDGSRVLVDLDATVSEELRKHIALIGGQLAPSPDSARIIRAMIPLAQVEALAGRADINFISPARLSVTSKIYADPRPQNDVPKTKP